MADNKNMALNDEAMAGAVGGENDERGRTRHAIVKGIHEHPYYKDLVDVTLEGGQDVVAHYDAINMVIPGKEVIVELIGQGKWKIVEFL